MNGSYWHAFLIWALCSNELHNTGTKRTGNCQRCGLFIKANGRAL